MAFDTRLLTSLSVVSAVIDAGNFARAGQVLHLSQSGVSRAIQRLEERIGVRLFERTSKTMRLTEEGRRFCTEVLPLLSRLEEATEETLRSGQTIRGRLRVNVDPTFARMVLARCVGDFLRMHPDLHIELVVRDGLGDMVAEGFDVAVRLGYPEPSALIAKRLLQYRILTCATRRYLAERGRPRTPQELETQRHECLLFRDPATGMPFPWEFHQAKKKLTVAFTGRLVLNDAVTHLEACIAGYGVAQVMDLGIESLIKNGKLVNLFPDWCDELFPLYAYHPSRHFVPAKLKAFTDFLVNALNSKQP